MTIERVPNENCAPSTDERQSSMPDSTTPLLEQLRAVNIEVKEKQAQLFAAIRAGDFDKEGAAQAELTRLLSLTDTIFAALKDSIGRG